MDTPGHVLCGIAPSGVFNKVSIRARFAGTLEGPASPSPGARLRDRALLARAFVGAADGARDRERDRARTLGGGSATIVSGTRDGARAARLLRLDAVETTDPASDAASSSSAGSSCFALHVRLVTWQKSQATLRHCLPPADGGKTETVHGQYLHSEHDGC